MSERHQPGPHVGGRSTHRPGGQCRPGAWNVVQRNATRQAMSAMAFTVTPLNVSVRFICPLGATLSAKTVLLFRAGSTAA